MAEKNRRVGPAKLKAWAVMQRPPWKLEFLAEVLGCNYTHLSNLMSYKQNRRPGFKLAKKIEILTNGFVTIEDMVMTPEEQEALEDRIQTLSPPTIDAQQETV